MICCIAGPKLPNQLAGEEVETDNLNLTYFVMMMMHSTGSLCLQDRKARDDVGTMAVAVGEAVLMDSRKMTMKHDELHSSTLKMKGMGMHGLALLLVVRFSQRSNM